jgi:sorbitol/mannitol transport system permease protein
MSTRAAIPSTTVGRAARVSRLRRPPFRLVLLLPAIIYLAVMTQAPFVLTLWYSLHKWILTSPELGVTWVGLDNFVYTITQDTIFRASIVNWLIITLGIVVPSLVLGLAFALLLHRRFPLRGLVRSLMIAPFFVMPTVNAQVWTNLLFNPVFGLVSWLTTSIGLGRIDVLAREPKLAVMVMAVWQWTPFMMLILLAGLQGLSDEVREAAQMDGASRLDEFRFVTLPLLGRYIELATLLGTIYVLQLFGEIFVATQGGPGTATTTIPYYVYQTISQSNDVGTSAAQGVLAVVVASVIAALLLRLLLRTFSRSVQVES